MDKIQTSRKIENVLITSYANIKTPRKKVSGRDSFNWTRGISGIVKSLRENWKNDIKSISSLFQSDSCRILLNKPISTWVGFFHLIEHHLLIKIEWNIYLKVGEDALAQNLSSFFL